MKPEEIKINDWLRIFIGEVPPAYLLEVVFRVSVMYLILLLAMRLLGKRMASQLTRNELAAMASLAAAIGVPIISPERGLLPALVIAIVVVAISRLVSLVSAKSQKVEAATHGALDTLVKDAVIDPKAMMKTRITKGRIMAELRSEQIKHMGEVKRLYMEANGTFTIIKAIEPLPGLPVIPENDPEFLRELPRNGILVCHTCGARNPVPSRENDCPNCSDKHWVPAVI
jgi:hypothetical protein